MIERTPNPQDPVFDKPTEDDLLIEQLAYSVGWRKIVSNLIAPRVFEMRQRLLRDYQMPELERRALQLGLLEYESFLQEVYARTESGEPPAWVQAIFH